MCEGPSCSLGCGRAVGLVAVLPAHSRAARSVPRISLPGFTTHLTPSYLPSPPPPQGPEIRTGFLENEQPVVLQAGAELTISTDYALKGNKDMITMSYGKLAQVRPDTLCRGLTHCSCMCKRAYTRPCSCSCSAEPSVHVRECVCSGAQRKGGGCAAAFKCSCLFSIFQLLPPALCL